jgi:hypothetical protein
MNLEFLSHQAIFDQAVKHLFQQRQAALLPRGGGAYRGYCGGCPVGRFIKPRATTYRRWKASPSAVSTSK